MRLNVLTSTNAINHNLSYSDICTSSGHPKIPIDIRYKQSICVINKQFLRRRAYLSAHLPSFKLETNRLPRKPPLVRSCAALCLQTRPRTRKYKRRSDRRDNETLKGRRHDIAQRDPKRQQKFNLKSTPTKRLPLWFNHTRNFYQLHGGHYAIMLRYLVRYICLVLLCIALKSSYPKVFYYHCFTWCQVSHYQRLSFHIVCDVTNLKVFANVF